MFQESHRYLRSELAGNRRLLTGAGPHRTRRHLHNDYTKSCSCHPTFVAPNHCRQETRTRVQGCPYDVLASHRNRLSGRTATPHGYGAPPPSPAGLARFMGVSFMCLSFVTVGMVHLVLVLHLTMVRGVGGFPRLTILFRWFMPACLLASTFVYFVQSMHTTRYGIWRSKWIAFCIAGVIFVVINLSMMLRPLRQVGLTAFE
uniref:Uncharacterized protein n=1 Tax=Oryza meridionalis TaxID=40149 RepID=A0A0E0EDX2_9ORYZ